MDSLVITLIKRAPTLLVIAALLLYISGVSNALATYQSLQGQGAASITYLFTFVFSAIYQPVILIAWAAAVHYLSILSMRMR